MRFIPLLCVAILSAIPAVGQDDAAPSITLMCWHGPPFNEDEVARYWRLKCNAIPATLNDQSTDYLDLAARGTMGVYLALPKRRQGTPADWAGLAQSRENGLGWILRYGAVPEDADQYAAEIAALKAAAPEKKALVTLAGDPAAWKTALPKLVAAGLPVVCFDHFPLLDDGTTDEAGYIARLQAGLELQEQSGVEVWATVQVSPFDGHRRASESDIRFQAYTALAYGARGIGYYAYWRDPRWMAYESWGPAMIDIHTGAAEYGYEMTGHLNRELVHLAPHLGRMRVARTGFVGDVPEGAAPFRAGSGPFSRVLASKALVTEFVHEDGSAWVMVVNRRHGDFRSAQTQAATIQIIVDDAVAAVTEIDRYSGYEKPIPLDETHGFYISIPGGTGSLFRITRSETTAAS